MKTKTSAAAIYSPDKILSLTAVASMLAIVLALLLAPLVHAADDIIPDKNTAHAAADVTPPSDIENVKAVAGNGYIDLSWNVAMDDTAIKGYKIYYGTKPVLEDGASYDLGPIDVGNKITYRLTGLTNGTTYYFAVTAYDDAGNESTNYSVEASATPAHAAADATAPTVVSAAAWSKTQVRVQFSEPVVLPSISPEGAFSIKKDSNQAPLAVLNAVMDTEWGGGKGVVLTTAPQQIGNYILTAGIQIKDSAGNPIVSGTSDTALFMGAENDKPMITEITYTQQTQAKADTTPPELVKVTVPDPAHVVIKFSEPVVLSSDPMQDFVITEEADIMNSLNIKNVRLEADSSVVTLTTDPQKPVNYNLIVPGIKDKAGNLISVESNATVFKGWDSGLMPMLTQETQAMTQQTQVQAKAPEDATKFAASLIGNAIVRLVWAASADTANNLANYILYKGTDGKSYGPGVLIDPETLKYDVNELVPGLKYFFKLTARSTTGNESKGVITTFVLPSTGPELGLLLFGSLGLGKFFSGKKKGGKKGGCGGSK